MRALKFSGAAPGQKKTDFKIVVVELLSEKRQSAFYVDLRKSQVMIRSNRPQDMVSVKIFLFQDLEEFPLMLQRPLRITEPTVKKTGVTQDPGLPMHIHV